MQTSTSINPTNAELAAKRFSKSMELCSGVIGDWVKVHCPGADLEVEIKMLASRVNSWVSPLSVIAGTRDVLSATRLKDHVLSPQAIESLGDNLARGLMEEGLLNAELKRSGFRRQS